MCVFSHFIFLVKINVGIFRNNPMDIADRLKFVRKKLKLTQESFAISIGLKRDNITSLELRKVKITTLHALAIEHVHGVNKDWLLNGDGEMFIVPPINIKKGKPDKVIKVVSEHQDLIKRFQNPQKAKEFNEFLISVEKHNPEGYENLYGLAKSIYSTTPDGQKKEGLNEIQSTKKQANGN